MFRQLLIHMSVKKYPELDKTLNSSLLCKILVVSGKPLFNLVALWASESENLSYLLGKQICLLRGSPQMALYELMSEEISNRM